LGFDDQGDSGAMKRKRIAKDKYRAPIAPSPLRVLIASHSHPKASNGGAEIAAYRLFHELQLRDDCKAWFLGCDRSLAAERAGVVLSQPYGEDEFVYSTGDFDWFKFANLDVNFCGEIERLFLQLAPDVVHFHHYINFGVEVFQHLKRVRPNCKIIVTLHEYLAICHHFGQMVTTDHHNLCYESSPARCHKCFSDFGRSDFFLRKLYIDRYFDLVDMFVSPSNFLAERYIAWGIPAEKMTVLENLTAPVPSPPLVPATPGAPLRVGFFGQISPLKGIGVVFDAAASLAKADDESVSFEIYGDYRGQPPAFQTVFLERLETAGPNIVFHGPYDRERVNQLMQSVDAVLVPSRWWENSPVVIQEALRNRRPVICSDIGGMAEKVRDGIDGFHFPAGNALALARLLRQLAANRSALDQLVERLPEAMVEEPKAADFMMLYRA
jgi:glycosyltransferase involved in cell wall biosynthesis